MNIKSSIEKSLFGPRLASGVRLYKFYENGRTLITERECLLRECRRTARGLFEANTRYVDVLDEGVLVERIG